jgi:protein-S-isoprenylcysteine O-methyltransferase Ste14
MASAEEPGDPGFQLRGRSKWLRVPPPLLFIVPLVVGLATRGRVPPVDLAGPAAAGAWYLGVAAAVLGGWLVLAAPVLFALRRTTIVPHATPSTLIVAGPYRITRNPMYLGLTLLYVGASLTLGLAWLLLVLPLPLWVLQTRTIPMEEANMRRLFGEEYERYTQRVGRWLG